MCIIISYTGSYRMIIVNVLICLIILASQSVHNKVITVNSNNGNDSTECCVNGECACSSLSTALLNISNNTIINITSESVALNNTTTMGSGKLTNIAITGSNVTIMCNNSGSVYCESCDDVRIEGITWDRCGDPNGTNIAGVTFDVISNISLVNCTFQHCQTYPVVSLLEVSDNVIIQGCSFVSNIPVLVVDNYYGILSISRLRSGFPNNSHVTIVINNSHFYNNGHLQDFTYDPGILPSSLYIAIDDESVVNCDVVLKKTKFISNRNAVDLQVYILQMINVELTEILVLNNSFLYGYNGVIGIGLSSSSSDVVLPIMSSDFTANEGGNVWCNMAGNKISTVIKETSFTDSKLNANSPVGTVSILNAAHHTSEITFYRVQINNNTMGIPYASILNRTAAGAISIALDSGDLKINMYMVNFTSNKYLGNPGGALYIFIDDGRIIDIIVQECQFIGNKSPGHGAALFLYIEDIDTVAIYATNVQIVNTHFDQNIAGSSVVYMIQNDMTQYILLTVQVNSSTFTNNIGNSMYLSACVVQFIGVVLFKNNTAENGGAMYLDQGTRVTIENEPTVQLIDNRATLNGGAIYVDLLCDGMLGDTFHTDMSSKYSTMFINNSARVAGNSLYFNIPRFCPLNSNISDSGSILYVPCQFKYSQPVNGKMMNIPCDLDYTLLNGTGAPIVTSPHELRLYFPFNDGYNISSPSNYNVYFITNNVLGYPVKFTSAVFDYFGKLAEPTLFNIVTVLTNNRVFYIHLDRQHSR